MTKNERAKHATDISNQFVPHLLEPNIISKMEELPIQDIITIYSNACYALEKGMFVGINSEALNQNQEKAVRFYNVINEVKDIIIQKLKNANSIWTVTDKITRSPFINDINEVWIFTEKEYADECVDYYMQQYRTTFEVTEISKEEITKFFGTTAYMKGAEAFYVDLGAYAGIKLLSNTIIPVPNFNNVPEINRPVMNPEFFRSVAKLQEERLYRANYEGKKEKLRRFEDDMIKSFCNAKFLVPTKGMRNIMSGSNGTISIPSLSKGENENKTVATPVFTDWNEFNKIYSQKEWDGWVWSPKDLLSAPEDMIVVNAGSLCFEMSKKMIQQILDIYEKEFAHKNEKTGGTEAIAAALNTIDSNNTNKR